MSTHDLPDYPEALLRRYYDAMKHLSLLNAESMHPETTQERHRELGAELSQARVNLAAAQTAIFNHTSRPPSAPLGFPEHLAWQYYHALANQCDEEARLAELLTQAHESIDPNADRYVAQYRRVDAARAQVARVHARLVQYVNERRTRE